MQLFANYPLSLPAVKTAELRQLLCLMSSMTRRSETFVSGTVNRDCVRSDQGATTVQRSALAPKYSCFIRVTLPTVGI